MRTIVNSTFVSLDGVINHMEKWHFDLLSEQSDQLAMRQLDEADSMLMGRNTYDAYAGAWPQRDSAYADRINALPKHVASTTLADPEWNNTTVIGSDLVTAVSELRAGDGGSILMHGFGPVAKSLTEAGLLDELHLWYHPVLAGVGGPDDVLLTPGLNVRFETTGAEVLDSGIVVISMKSRS
jgi:dihydrofolate reductase